MIHVLGASMPRSGHHLLEMILKNALRDRFAYCEFYEPGCCKSIPCVLESKIGGASIFMQKSHDFEFTDPVIVPGTYRIIQYRSPVPRALSNYELHLKNGCEDTVRNFRDFLIDEALYFARFYEKWISNCSPQHHLLGYEELTGHPVKAALDFFAYIDMPIDRDRVIEGVAEAITIRGRDQSAFVYSNVYAHRYASHPLLANFEDLAIASCPGYYPLRYFPVTNSPESLIGLLFAARKALNEGHRALALSLAEAAVKQHPRDPTAARVLSAALAVSKEQALAPRSDNCLPPSESTPQVPASE